MAVNWTNDQKSAIEYRDNSVIVSAAAGSGKTAVLVERIMKITRTVPIDRLLIVTFTRDAAAQMRKGIADSFSELIADDNLDEDLRKNYRQQLLLLPDSDICTIDSFCTKIVKENFEKLGISVNFSTIDNNQAVPLFNEVLNDLTESKFECDDKDILILADGVCDYNNTEKLNSLIEAVYKFVQKSAFPEKALSNLISNYNEDVQNHIWSKISINLAQTKLKEIALKYKIAVTNILNYNPDFEKYQDTANEDLETILLVSNCNTYQDMYNALNNISWTTLPTLKELGKTEIAENFKKARDGFKKSVGAVKGFSTSPEDLKTFFALQKPVIEALVNIVSEFSEKYFKAKLERNVLEFNDLSHLAIKLLVDENQNPTPLAKEISDNYDEIIIDEYQDTNDIQEILLNAVSKESSNIFMVGDMKQSIYKFRNTAPELFAGKVETFSDDGQGLGKRIYLSENFRSRKNILDFTNLIFEQTMSKETGEVDYREKEKLNNGATYYPKGDLSTDVIIMEKPASNTEVTFVELEAYQAATEISRLMESKTEIYDKKLKTTRPIKYSDIAILLRTSKNVTEAFSDTLTKCGIPVYNDNNNVVLADTIEVQLILNFLKIIDNPYQDIPLVSVLKSFLFDFDENMLIKIKKHSNTASFYDALENYDQNDEEKNKIIDFLNILSSLTQDSYTSGITKLIDKIDTIFNYSEYILTMPGGTQRYSNFKFFKSVAKTYETTETGGLFGFIKHLDNINGTSASVAAPKVLPDSADTVIITTIHKSKGLEYPVVILPTLGKNVFTDIDAKNIVLMHKNIGIGLDHLNFDENYKIKSPVKETIKTVNKLELFAEEMRILYVALTRAKEKLILIGSLSDLSKTIEKVSSASLCSEKLLLTETVFSANSYLELILAALYRTKAFDIFERENQNYIETDALINIKVIEEPEIAEFDVVTKETVETKESYDDIKSILEYSYPYQESKIFMKYTVSELKRLITEPDTSEEYFSHLAVLNTFDDDKITSAEKGSIFHYVLEKFDFKCEDPENELDTLLKTLTDNDVLTQAEADTVDKKAILEFLKSPLGELLKTSDEIYKEHSFNILTKDVFENQAENIQLQGVIDCYFKKDDDYIILDFKTGNSKNNDVNESYKLQLEFYKKAVKIMHNTDNIKAYLYFFGDKTAIKV